MEAIVLAGGLGTRLRAAVPDLPKSMAPIGDRPFLELLLARLAAQGFRHVVLSLGYRAEMIVQYFGHQYAGMRLSHVIEPRPLGTGGGARLALDRCEQDHVYLLNGDTFIDLDYTGMEALWHRHREPIIVAREVDDVSRYGCLEVRDQQVVAFAEKGGGGSGLINAGCYVLGHGALDVFPVGIEFSLEKDFLSPLVGRSPCRLFVSGGYFIDLGIPEDYIKAQSELLPFLATTTVAQAGT